MRSAAGADAIGLVFYPPSPRYVSLAQAAPCCAVPPFIATVGLFVNPTADEVLQAKMPRALRCCSSTAMKRPSNATRWPHA